jgi:hypothetical protein
LATGTGLIPCFYVVAKNPSKSPVLCTISWQAVFFFLRWGIVSLSPNPQAGGPHLVGCPRLLNQYIRSYPALYGGRLLHPQPEESPCCDDRYPYNILIHLIIRTIRKFIHLVHITI